MSRNTEGKGTRSDPLDGKVEGDDITQPAGQIEVAVGMYRGYPALHIVMQAAEVGVQAVGKPVLHLRFRSSNLAENIA